MTTYEIAPCPVCRNRTMRTIAAREDLERELEWLWQFHLRRLKPGAPIHQLFDRAIFSQPLPLHLVQCTNCGTVFRNPRERAEDVVELYEGEEPSPAALASLFEQQYAFYAPRVRKITEMVGSSGNVLEVGSYLGAFLRAAAAAGWRGCGLDVNPTANAFAREQGVEVIESSLESFDTKQKFDAVAIWNCFDQLPDPHESLESTTSLLVPGGLLVVRVPNGEYYAEHVRRRSPFARILLAWNNLATFPYRHGFTPASLATLLQAHGYRVVDVVHDQLVRISGEWTRAWAQWEERLVKAAPGLGWIRKAPWFEVYARSSKR